MKFHLLPLSVLVLSLSACQTPGASPAGEAVATEAKAQDIAEGKAPDLDAGTEPMVGNYQDRDVTDESVVAAANEAVKLLQESEADPSIALVKIRKASAQVVAGMNYDLDLDLSTANGPTSKRVIVYRQLNGEYSLTSVETIQ